MLHSNSRPQSAGSSGGSPPPGSPPDEGNLPPVEPIFEQEETVFSVASPSGQNGSSSPDNKGARDARTKNAQDDGRNGALAVYNDGRGRGRGRGRDGYSSGFGSDGDDDPRRDERDEAGAGAMEVADEASIRDFYSQLVTLLTQDGTARAPVKKSRAGLKEAIRRRFWPALLVFLLTLGGLGYALRPRQATYVSSVRLLLPARDTSANKDTVSPEELYDAPAQIAIIGSEPIVREAMKRVPPALRKRGFGDANAQMAPVDVSSGASDEVVTITVSSLDPAASLVTAQAMVNTYTDHMRNRFSQNSQKNLDITRKTASKLNSQLNAAQQSLTAFKQRNGVLDYGSTQSNATNTIAGLQSSLDAARRDAVGAVASDSTLLSLQGEASTAQTNYEKITREFFPDSDQARAAKALLDAAQARVASRGATIESDSRNRIRQLETSLSRARAQASSLPAIEQQLGRLNESVQTLQTASRAANERRSQLELSAGAVAPVATALDSPGVGSSQTMQRARAFFVALLSALALSTLAAWLLDRADRSVRTAPDPENLFGAPVLGALPASTEHRTFYLAPTNSNKGNARSRTQTIEACTNAQNNILAAATAAGARSILLTSALPEEGKSGCASNLAAAMAYGGREVLLVDVDFWHPSQHSNFDMELTPGYSQVLRDNLPLSEAIRQTPVDNLFLLSTGQDSSTPGDIIGLLQGRTHRSNMELLKKYFDIIVIDAPPTMTVADAQLLSGLADAVVLVTAEKTARDEVQRARSMLRLAGAWILGVVVNSVRPGEMDGWNLNFSGEEPFADYSQSLRNRGRGH